VEQIKKHPFFYGVDWTAIRNIEAPFIPRLRSITDTSYFPTDELDQVPDEPAGGDTTGAHKELAFLGYVVLSIFDPSRRLGKKKTDVCRVLFFGFLQVYVQEVHNLFERFLICCRSAVFIPFLFCVVRNGTFPLSEKQEMDGSVPPFRYSLFLRYVT